MFHYITGQRNIRDNQTYIINPTSGTGIQVQYNGHKKEGEFFLYPYFDDNQKTYRYLWFDNVDQKHRFEKLTKKKWIWRQIAFTISSIDQDELREIVNTIDTKALSAYPGIGPKTAKKIIIELKDELSVTEIKQITTNTTTHKQITKHMINLWYDKWHIESLLQEYEKEISPKTMNAVITYLIKSL